MGDDRVWTVLLVVSNISVIPALYAAATRGLIFMSVAILAVGISSLSYHMCQSGYACAAPLEVLRVVDHASVYAMLTVSVMFFLDVPGKWRAATHTVLTAILHLVLPNFIDSVWVPVVVIGTATVFGVTWLCVYFKHLKTCIDWVDTFVAAFLIAAGITFFVVGGDPGKSERYPWAHTLWHVVVFTALWMVIEAKVPGTVFDVWRWNTFHPDYKTNHPRATFVRAIPAATASGLELRDFQ